MAANSGRTADKEFRFTLDHDGLEVGRPRDHVVDNGPGLVQDYRPVVVFDPHKAVVVAVGAPCDVKLHDSGRAESRRGP